ncbi:MAG: UDP-N-acetylmuramate--L-alanine ligase [Flammeovirgaceae bacterium]
MRIHFIAIGGSVMHHLAIALKEEGHQVSGSDDVIFDPAESNLKEADLFPDQLGWDANRISNELDLVILGMHAKNDNPELAKAQELGLKVYSYPEFIYEHSKNKQRIVIGGSHGKTSVTAMILHALNQAGRKFDYVIGALPQDFESTIRLSEDAPIIVVEGDEYLTSALDPTPKFLYYQAHIRVITGIAWDHINVFPTFEGYVEQFKRFAEQAPKAGTLIYNTSDKVLKKLIKQADVRHDVVQIPYEAHKYKIKDGQTLLSNHRKEQVPIHLIGEHNMLNLNAAKQVCLKIGISEDDFYEAISSFTGASMRMELVDANENAKVYRDFAHAPSKLEATINAVKSQFPKRTLVACMELHTYSSLNKNFLANYKDTMKKADEAVVFYNPKTVENKRLEQISDEELRLAFNDKKLHVFTDVAKMKSFLLAQNWKNANLLMMSSGNYANLDIKELSSQLLNGN